MDATRILRAGLLVGMMLGVDCSDSSPCDVTQRQRTVEGDLELVASTRDMEETARLIASQHGDEVDVTINPSDAAADTAVKVDTLDAELAGDASDAADAAGDAGTRADSGSSSAVLLPRDHWTGAHVELTDKGCVAGAACVVITGALAPTRCGSASSYECASVIAPVLSFDRPPSVGVHELRTLRARVCDSYGNDFDCPEVEGQLVVRSVETPCPDQQGADLCGRLDADITIVGTGDLTASPGVTGHATLFYRDDRIRSTCMTGGCGGKGFGPE